MVEAPARISLGVIIGELAVWTLSETRIIDDAHNDDGDDGAV